MKHRAVFLAAWVLAGTALLVRSEAWGAVQSSPQDELRAKSKAVLEKPTVAARRALQQYARQNGGSPNGALARLVLGYAAYQERQYAQAREQFQAARVFQASEVAGENLVAQP